MELLAPAGNHACLEAALEAGADAVYLGLTTLNARRHARNFTERGLEDACALVHARGKRVHLTLNIDLAQDELERAAQVLELASDLGVDAVLVRDPALLALKPHFPTLTYHLSTQGCAASRADVEAARELGVARVVLAREMALPEIAAASRVDGVETEVFVHGAMCFAVSGRCLLSSWAGGRSGNRGQCTSPCRVPWTLDGRPAGNPLSMHDLSLVTRVTDLASAGVRAVKIEGRMKNPSWVGATVALWRKALDGTAPVEELAREAQRRGATPGRRLTSAYLDGRRDGLVEPPVTSGSPETSTLTRSVMVRPGAAALLAEAGVARVRAPRVTADRARVHADQVEEFLLRVAPSDATVVEGLDAGRLARVTGTFPGRRLVAALPAVLLDQDEAWAQSLVTACVERGVTVEVNTWGGWRLARRAGARVVGGPGMGVLNALAVRDLAARGFTEVTASVEIDGPKLEALVARCVLPCSVVVFGRPPLVVTRAELPPDLVSGTLEDDRRVMLSARRDRGTWQLRAVDPFDWREARLPPGVSHTVVDLVGSPDPVTEWERPTAGASRFNLDRVLG
jgi:collagenase-like PrtC family protease